MDQKPIMKFFECDHLPMPPFNIAIKFKTLAESLDEHLPDGPEKSAGLRKLLEAKDCMVRAAL